MSKIFQELNRHIKVCTKLINKINNLGIKYTFTAGEKLLQPGEQQNNLFFLDSGIVRGYYKSGEKEWTSYFFQPGEFILSIDNFLFDLPCTEYIETCTQVKLISFKKSDYLLLLMEHPDLHIFAKNISNEGLRKFTSRMYKWRMLPAKERYYSFVDEFPEINKSVQLRHIASYLDITPYSLSRIRKSYREKFH